MPSIQGKTILLVEDETILAMTGKMQLEKYGYMVRTVDTGEKAIEEINSNADIELVLMDINLGDGIDGTEAAAIILEAHDIPIVFVSSHSEREIVEKTEKITSYGYVVKNSSITVLDASIKMAFKLFDARKNEIEKEKALMKSEEKYRLISENTSDGILHINADSIIDYASPAYLKQLGYPEIEEIGRDSNAVCTLMHPDDRGIIFSTIVDAINNNKNELTYTYRVMHAEGYYIWREDHANFMYDSEGKYNGAYVSCRDVTERKNIENKLIVLGKALEASPATIVITDVAGTIQYVNPKFSISTGYSSEEVVGKNPRILKSSMTDVKVYADMWNTLHAGKDWKGCFINRKKNGEIYYESATIAPVKNLKGEITNYIAIKEDLTEKDISQDERYRREEVESLRKSKESAEMLIDVAAEIIISEDFDGNVLLLNKSGHAILGYESPELVGKNFFETCLPADARDEVRRYFKSLQNGMVESIVTHENDVITKNGTRITILWHNSIIKDGEGRSIGMFSSGQDITQMNRFKKELIESNEKYRLLVENSHDIIYTLNPAGEFLFVSAAWTPLLGHPVAQVVGHSFRDFVHPDDVPGCLVWLDKVIASGQRQEGVEYRARHVDGSWYWHTSSAVPLRDQTGNVIGFEGTARDITERKTKDDKIKSLLAEKELLLKEVHHRIKNNMNTISSLLSLQADTMGESSATLALQDAGNRIQSMSLLYDKLYQSPDYTKLPIQEYLSSLIDEVVGNFPYSRNVKIEKFIQNFTLDAKRLQPVTIIINELLTNIMKYAFKDKASGLVTVSASVVDARVMLKVHDDGHGIPPAVSVENSTGFGLQLVHALADQLKGNIQFERAHGTKVVLEFPF